MLTERSKELLTINTHKGLYQYQRLPFGVSTAPAILQCVMDQVLSGMKGVVCYLDDIFISSGTKEEHIQTLNEVMDRLDKYGVKARRNKCSFMVGDVIYLGHVLNSEGIHQLRRRLKQSHKPKFPKMWTSCEPLLGLLYIIVNSSQICRVYVPLCITCCEKVLNGTGLRNVKQHFNQPRVYSQVNKCWFTMIRNSL